MPHSLRAPIWFYRARLGWLFGHRPLSIAHRGRRTPARGRAPRPGRAEVAVIAAWGLEPDWYRNFLMRAWHDSAGIPGGFMWLFDDIQQCAAQGSPADYARAINNATG